MGQRYGYHPLLVVNQSFVIANICLRHRQQDLLLISEEVNFGTASPEL